MWQQNILHAFNYGIIVEYDNNFSYEIIYVL